MSKTQTAEVGYDWDSEAEKRYSLATINWGINKINELQKQQRYIMELSREIDKQLNNVELVLVHVRRAFYGPGMGKTGKSRKAKEIGQ